MLEPTTAPLPLTVTHAQTATNYARSVVDGTIIAGKLAIAACKRHLDDLEASKDHAFPYRFDEAAAARACKFIELLPHVKGEWAKRKELIRLEPFQVFGIASVFGWLRKSDGRRRFRRAYWELPRKNGKSTVAAGIGLYCGAADGEEGAEVYCGATSRDQAWEVFRPMKQMVERTPQLRDGLGLVAWAEAIQQAATSSRIEPVIGKPGDGASPSLAIIDEYHEHATSELHDTMQTGMGARAQPLLFVITTAGTDLQGPCYQMHTEVRNMLNGVAPDPELFGLIYTLDDEEDWTTEAALWKANPSAGASVSIDYLRSQQRQAISNSTKSGIFRTKHLNQWVTARSPFFNVEAWRKCERKIRMPDFAGRSGVLFLDLASKKDLAVCVAVFRSTDGTFDVLADFWLPEDRVNEVKTAPYQAWADDGWLTVTPGNVIDFEFIEERLRELASEIEIREVCFDPFQATQLSTRMMAEGFPMVEYGATVKNFSEPMKELDKLILSGRIRHDGNAILAWCLSNVVAKIDAKENVYPRKERPENKIDGAVALIGAIGRWMGHDVDEDPSPFVGL